MKLYRYISLNILSLVGYFYLLLSLYLSFVVKPEVMAHKYVEDIDTTNLANTLFYSNILVNFVKLSFIIFFIFLFLFIIEFILIKVRIWNFKFESENKLYIVLFSAGLILQLYPTIFFMYPIVLKIFNLH